MEKKEQEGQALSGIPGYLCLAMIFGGLGLCIASIVAPAWFAERGLSWLTAGGFGLLFFGAGLAALLSGQIIGLVFMLVGLTVGGGAAFVAYAPKESAAWFMDNVVPMLLLSVFVLVGLGFLIAPPVIRRQKRAKYTEVVPATVTGKDMRWHRDSKGRRHRSYYLSWRYYYRGEWHTYRSNRGRNPEKREPGAEGTLRLDPANPSGVWEEDTVAEKVLFAVMGLIFAGAGGFAMYAFLFLRG